MATSPRRKIPSYRHHKPTDQAFVELSGKRLYLGRHGTPASRAKYDQRVAEWLAAGRTLPVEPSEITIVELLARFMAHAQRHYRRPDGSQTSEVHCYRSVVRILEMLYATRNACAFGPLQLKALREKMVGEKWTRGTINQAIGRVRSIFRWAASECIIPDATYQALKTVTALRAGRSEAHDNEPVGPVPMEHVEAVKPHVSSQVWGLIQLQLWSGARPGEVCGLRPCDIDTTKMPWVYRVRQHKTAYRNKPRIILFGPEARAVISDFLAGRAVDKPLFSPLEAEAERRAKMHAERTTPMSCGNVPGSNRVRKPKWEPGDAYDVASYRRAIERGCKLARVPTWSPHQLRHSAASRIDREAGLELASLVLGHSSAQITDRVYVERDQRRAAEVVERVG